MMDEEDLEHYKLKAQIVDFDEDEHDPYEIEVRTNGDHGPSSCTNKVDRRYTPEGALLIASAMALGLRVDDVLDTDELEDDDF